MVLFVSYTFLVWHRFYPFCFKQTTQLLMLTPAKLNASIPRKTPIWNRQGCSSEILNLTPKGDHQGVPQAFCDP